MPHVVIRTPSDPRFSLRDRHSEVILDDLITANASNSGAPLRLLVMVAHPDDEALGAGALLARYPDAMIAHLTDGGGMDDVSAQARGFANRGEYAAARRAEVVAALTLIGIPSERVRSLGIPDGEAGRRLVECCHRIMGLMDDLQPDVVLTHPYEGGHSDHDAVAFGVQLAAGVLRREGGKSPIVLELTSYHNSNGERVRGRFLPRVGQRVKTVVLDAAARLRKTQMLSRFTTQLDVVEKFPIVVERFRVAPRYLFTEAPHDGPLDYELRCMRFTGEEWRAQAAIALEQLRARKRTSSRQLE